MLKNVNIKVKCTCDVRVKSMNVYMNGLNLSRQVNVFLFFFSFA